MDESNSLSLFFCTTAPVLVAGFNSRIPLWLKGLCAMAIALAGVGEILTISRAGVVIMGVVLLGAALATMSFRLTARKVAICLVVVLAATGVVAKAWKTLMFRFAESTLKEEYQTKRNMGRGYYLRVAQAIARERVLRGRPEQLVVLGDAKIRSAARAINSRPTRAPTGNRASRLEWAATWTSRRPPRRTTWAR